MMHPVWVEINLDNLEFNLKQIKNKIGNSEIISVIKANAYGHGALECAKLLSNIGINRFGVANIMEAIELRKDGVNDSIMILGICTEDTIEEIIKYDIEVTVSTYDFAKKLSEASVKNHKISSIHIKLDTGMGRIGFLQRDEDMQIVEAICNLENINVESIFSHFASADSKDKSYTEKQLDIYNKEITEIKYNYSGKIKRNIANSAGIIDVPESCYDYVRPGIIQYGYYPSEDVMRECLDLKPVLTWKSRIVHLKTLDENKYIGYGQKFRTTRKSKIATIPVGYADGYSRILSGKAKVIIDGKLCPVVGNICMDQIMVDVTELEDVQLSDEVTLLGRAENVKFDADDMAEIMGTINYEVLCNIGRRVTRVYERHGERTDVVNYVF
ncbi:alanine racemase [Clostridium folliculivorans]|nr:alanine racemase [Clostridium folliculivorans]